MKSIVERENVKHPCLNTELKTDLTLKILEAYNRCKIVRQEETLINYYLYLI